MQGFRPGLGPTVLSLLAIGAFCALGVWQVYRHQWRSEDLAEKAARTERAELRLDDALREPGASSFRRTTVRGTFELADTILVGPAERGRELGARVLTPLRLAATPDGARVLVDRGFVPQGEMERFLPGPVALGDELAVSGLLLELAISAESGSRSGRRTHFPIFHPDRPGKVAQLQQQLPYPLLPMMVQATGAEPGGLPVGDVARPVSPVDHRGYALTWFAVAALSLGAFVEYGRRRAREGA